LGEQYEKGEERREQCGRKEGKEEKQTENLSYQGRISGKIEKIKAKRANYEYGST
jgi:hypothetical protein